MLDRRVSDSHKGFGIVSWHSKGFNQREELVIDFKRTNLVRLRNSSVMPFLTEERRMIQEQAREFTLNEVLPVANKLDPEKGDIPMELREKMAELGYFGILIPEEYGGLGLGCSEYCLVTEELSRGWMSVASIIARGNLLIGSQEMSEEQRKRYLPRMAKGEFLGAFSMSEPNAGSDISNISCRAKKDGDGYLISGNKYWCTFADGADFMIIIARTSGRACRQAPSRPVDVLRREEARRAAQGRATARRFPRSAISAGRPGNWPSTISASKPPT